ncbi:hypothetical protein ACWC2H_21185 [Streptomyces sp. 900105755]
MQSAEKPDRHERHDLLGESTANASTKAKHLARQKRTAAQQRS